MIGEDEYRGKGGILVEAPASYVGSTCLAYPVSVDPNQDPAGYGHFEVQFVPHPKQPITKALATFPQRMAPGSWAFIARKTIPSVQINATIFADNIGNIVFTEEPAPQLPRAEPSRRGLLRRHR